MKIIDPILLSTFTTILLAELGDKTQIATVAMSGKSNKPLAVFIGSSTALVLACLLGTLAGGSISNFIPTVLLKALAAVGFLYIGVILVISSTKQVNE
ncbi:MULTISPECIES: TMEM165/GDT1 family protein [Prochlorococcus]|uniref:TMEM165/GDT1 family protein n=1 Tax=Prochlorococcus TaxID=1218 RepID=UPI0009DEEAE5|nr:MULTISPECIES: TMEM165/GDT1 family protein [Prochlorococcus]